MPKVENLFKVLQLGTRLKQLKLQEEEKRREGEKEERFLESISDSPELMRAYYLTQGGMPWDKAIEISGHITPVQKEKKALERTKFASGFTQVRPEAVTKMGLPLKQFMRQAEIKPTGFTVPIKGAPLEVSRELRQLRTEEKPTEVGESEKERYWLGRSASETPLGRKNQLLKKGYIIKSGLWMPGPTLQENMLRDPRFQALYNLAEAKTKVRLSREGEVFSEEHVPLVWGEAIKAYYDLMDVTAGRDIEGQGLIDDTVGKFDDLIK